MSFSEGEYGVRTWYGRTGDPKTYLVGGKPLRNIGFTDDATTIYSGHPWNRDTLTFWDRWTIDRTGVLRGHRESIYDVTFDTTGHQLASIDWDGKVLRWDADTEKLLATYDLGEYRFGRSVAFHPSGEHLAAVSIGQRGKGIVAIIDRTSAKITDQWEYPSDTEDFRVCWEPTGAWLLSGGTKGFVHWHRLGQPTAERNTLMHEKPPWSPSQRYPETCADVVCSPDGKYFATAGYDRTVRLGMLDQRERIAVFEGHDNTVMRVQFSPNSRWLASASTDGTVHLWDIESRTILATLPHGTVVYGIAFSPDGTRLASGCADSSIRLWDLATFTEVAQLRGHSNYVHALAFSPDGKRLASASGDKTIRLWETQRGTHPMRNAELKRKE